MPLSTWLDTPCGQWCSFFSTIASSKVVRKTCCQARDVWWDATSKSRRLFAAAAIAQYSIWIYVLSLGSWLSFFRGKKWYSIHVFMQRLFEIHTLLSSMRKSKVLKFKILFDIEFFSSNQDFLIRKIKEPELNFNIIHCVFWIRRARAPLLQPLSQTWVGARQWSSTICTKQYRRICHSPPLLGWWWVYQKPRFVSFS